MKKGVYSLVNHKPRAIAIKPTAKLNRVYSVKKRKSPLFIKEWLSNANVEKVVNPPQKPVVNNKVWFWESKLFLKDIPNTIPISKHPIILTKNVPKKKFWKYELKILEIKYLRTLPIPPPKNTSSILFIP